MPLTGDRSPRPEWHGRAGALAAVAGLALTANQVGLRTSAFDNGWRGEALSWADIGGALAVALLAICCTGHLPPRTSRRPRHPGR